MTPARPRPSSALRARIGAFALVLCAVPSAALEADDVPPAPPPSPPPAAAGSEAKPAAAAGAAARKPAGAATSAQSDWRTGDELDVRVLSRSDLSCTVRVLADGTVDVPFSGRFRAVGRTLEELKSDVEAAFSKHERDPQVSIVVASLAPDEFYVLGEVGKSGVYTVPRTKRVSFLHALGMAGGFNAEADFTRVQVVAAGGGEPRTVDASPGNLASLAGVSVTNGDTIVVPAVGRIYLMGQVNRTGGFTPPAGERLTLTRAIALAGSFAKSADTTSVLVTWRTAQGESVGQRYNVKAILNGVAEDVVVYPGNLIFVPERLF